MFRISRIIQHVAFSVWFLHLAYVMCRILCWAVRGTEVQRGRVHIGMGKGQKLLQRAGGCGLREEIRVSLKEEGAL